MSIFQKYDNIWPAVGVKVAEHTEMREETVNDFASLSQALTLGIAAALAPTRGMGACRRGQHVGFRHGFWHPIGGLDHVLAMVAVGMFAANLGGRALWAVPLLS